MNHPKMRTQCVRMVGIARKDQVLCAEGGAVDSRSTSIGAGSVTTRSDTEPTVMRSKIAPMADRPNSYSGMRIGGERRPCVLSGPRVMHRDDGEILRDAQARVACASSSAPCAALTFATTIAVGGSLSAASCESATPPLRGS